MAMFLREDTPTAYHCVGWGLIDDPERATWRYFDNREECKDFAQQKYEAASSEIYIWMCEWGIYYNRSGTVQEDWMYWWWTKNCGAGQLPELGTGVPNSSKSWFYSVPYKSGDPKRAGSN
jgi:hypothetical protein